MVNPYVRRFCKLESNNVKVAQYSAPVKRHRIKDGLCPQSLVRCVLRYKGGSLGLTTCNDTGDSYFDIRQKAAPEAGF